MLYNPDIHHRRSIRLKGYDYSQAGAYFVTICIQQRQPLLGKIEDSLLIPTPAGEMVQTVWDEMPLYYPNIELDAFIVMPNHVHGIIVLKSDQGQSCMTLGDAVHRFKSFTTAKYRQGVYQKRWQPFTGRLWQRNYYEHIIRKEGAYHRIRQYIANNPFSWECDQLHPSRSANSQFE